MTAAGSATVTATRTPQVLILRFQQDLLHTLLEAMRTSHLFAEENLAAWETEFTAESDPFARAIRLAYLLSQEIQPLHLQHRDASMLLLSLEDQIQELLKPLLPDSMTVEAFLRECQGYAEDYEVTQEVAGVVEGVLVEEQEEGEEAFRSARTGLRQAATTVYQQLDSLSLEVERELGAAERRLGEARELGERMEHVRKEELRLADKCEKALENCNGRVGL